MACHNDTKKKEKYEGYRYLELTANRASNKAKERKENKKS
jgi:hypothetical protein